MMLQINNEWRITTDPYNYILQKSRIAKEGKNKGEITWSSVSFHPTLKSACERLIDGGLKELDLQEANKIINYLDRINQDIINAIERGLESSR